MQVKKQKEEKENRKKAREDTERPDQCEKRRRCLMLISITTAAEKLKGVRELAAAATYLPTRKSCHNTFSFGTLHTLLPASRSWAHLETVRVHESGFLPAATQTIFGWMGLIPSHSSSSSSLKPFERSLAAHLLSGRDEGRIKKELPTQRCI